MPKRKLAIILASLIGVVGVADLLLALGLALDHKPYILPLASMTALIPGFIVASRAWRGRLASTCSASRSRPFANRSDAGNGRFCDAPAPTGRPAR